MYGVLVRAFRIGNGRARAGKDAARDRAHRRSDRRLGLQGWFDTHIRFYEGVHDNPMGPRMTV